MRRADRQRLHRGGDQQILALTHPASPILSHPGSERCPGFLLLEPLRRSRVESPCPDIRTSSAKTARGGCRSSYGTAQAWNGLRAGPRKTAPIGGVGVISRSQPPSQREKRNSQNHGRPHRPKPQRERNVPACHYPTFSLSRITLAPCMRRICFPARP